MLFDTVSMQSETSQKGRYYLEKCRKKLVWATSSSPQQPILNFEEIIGKLQLWYTNKFQPPHSISSSSTRTNQPQTNHRTYIERWHQTRNCAQMDMVFFSLQICFGPPPKWQVTTTFNVCGLMSMKNHNISLSNLT